VLIDWTSTFDAFLDRLEAEGGQRLVILLSLLEVLEDLDGMPKEESATLKRVRQGHRYPLWRVAHPFVPGIAMRLIAWFAPSGEVVVAATAFDKAGVGDVWYASAVTTANAVIDEWKRVNDK
jgi:hypothetical protein